MWFIECGTIPVVFGRKVSPAIVDNVPVLLGIAYINRMRNDTQFLSDAHIIPEDSVTVKDSILVFGRRIITASLPIASVPGRKWNGACIVVFQDTKYVFSQAGMVMNAELKAICRLRFTIC